MIPGQRPGVGATTTFELVCNFVVVTGTLPPLMASTMDGRLDSSSAPGRLQPASLRYWLLSLTRMLQQLQKVSHWTLLPGKRSPKIDTLVASGTQYKRAGAKACVTPLSYAEITSSFIAQVVANPGAKTFSDYLETRMLLIWSCPFRK